MHSFGMADDYSVAHVQEPPSFLLPGQLIEIELAKQVQLQAISQEEESLVDSTPPVEPAANENVFDREFGRTGFTEGFDFTAKKDERFVTYTQLKLCRSVDL